MDTVAGVRDAVVALLMFGGTFLMLVTGIGLLRLPDVYCRMHAGGKAGTLGVAMLILAPGLAFASSEPMVSVRAILAIVFQGLTSPGATYLLAHACYARGYPLHGNTVMDELRDVMPSYPEEEFGDE